MTAEAIGKTVTSVIPARLDRLPWSPFHTRLVLALGVAWILDGLEITVASAIGATLAEPSTLALSSAAWQTWSTSASVWTAESPWCQAGLT